MFKCEVCRRKVGPNKVQRKHVLYRQVPVVGFCPVVGKTFRYRTEVLREIPVCPSCEAALADGVPLAELWKKYPRPPKENKDPVPTGGQLTAAGAANLGAALNSLPNGWSGYAAKGVPLPPVEEGDRVVTVEYGFLETGTATPARPSSPVFNQAIDLIEADATATDSLPPPADPVPVGKKRRRRKPKKSEAGVRPGKPAPSSGESNGRASGRPRGPVVLDADEAQEGID